MLLPFVLVVSAIYINFKQLIPGLFWVLLLGLESAVHVPAEIILVLKRVLRQRRGAESA